MKRYLYLIAVIILVSGCGGLATPQDIVNQANAINTQDGVSRSEAKVLAQKFLIDNSLQGEYDINNIGSVSREGNDWIVYFKSSLAYGAGELRRRGFTPSTTVIVNASTGVASLGAQ